MFEKDLLKMLDEVEFVSCMEAIIDEERNDSFPTKISKSEVLNTALKDKLSLGNVRVFITHIHQLSKQLEAMTRKNDENGWEYYYSVLGVLDTLGYIENCLDCPQPSRPVTPPVCR